VDPVPEYVYVMPEIVSEPASVPTATVCDGETAFVRMTESGATPIVMTLFPTVIVTGVVVVALAWFAALPIVAVTSHVPVERMMVTSPDALFTEHAVDAPDE
jgi:hypothetical protein